MDTVDIAVGIVAAEVDIAAVGNEEDIAVLVDFVSSAEAHFLVDYELVSPFCLALVSLPLLAFVWLHYYHMWDQMALEHCCEWVLLQTSFVDFPFEHFLPLLVEQKHIWWIWHGCRTDLPEDGLHIGGTSEPAPRWADSASGGRHLAGQSPIWGWKASWMVASRPLSLWGFRG